MSVACAPIYGDPPSAPSEERATSSGGETSTVPSNPIEAGRRLAQLEQQVRAGEETHRRLSDIARRATEEATRLRREAAAATAQPPPAAPAAPTQPPPPTPAPPMMGGMPGFGGLNPLTQPLVRVPRHGVVGGVGWIDVVPPARAMGGYAPTLAVTRINPGYATEFIIAGRRVCPTYDGQSFTQIVTENGQQICVLPASNSNSPTVVFEMFREGGYIVTMRAWSVPSHTGMGTLVGERSIELRTVNQLQSTTSTMDVDFH